MVNFEMNHEKRTMREMLLITFNNTVNTRRNKAKLSMVYSNFLNSYITETKETQITTNTTIKISRCYPNTNTSVKTHDWFLNSCK